MFEAIENALPALLLQLGRIFVFRIESFHHPRVMLGLREFDGDVPVVSKREVQCTRRFDLREDAFEIEPERPVLGLHAVFERAAYAQIRFCAGAAPSVGREIPVLDVLGRDPCIPNGLDGCGNQGFDSDFHDEFQRSESGDTTSSAGVIHCDGAIARRHRHTASLAGVALLTSTPDADDRRNAHRDAREKAPLPVLEMALLRGQHRWRWVLIRKRFAGQA